MKKTALALLVGAAATLASCSTDDLATGVVGASGEVTVQFGLEVPEGIYSRATNDGTKATNLTVVVFAENGDFIYQEDRGEVFASGKSQTVNIDLISGHSYIIGFWVDAPVAAGAADPYDITKGVLTINYDGAKANDDTRDAFFAFKPITVSPTQLTQSITLSRPFAQLNLGSSDYASATNNLGKTVTKSAAKIKGCAYASMSLSDGTVKGDVVDVTFAMNALPDYDGDPAVLTTVSGTSYAWLGMNYVLCDAAGGTVSEIEFAVDDETIPARSYTAGIPLKRNFRSNLLGKILTESTGWEVNIDSDFGPSNGQVIDISMWDGQVQMPDIDDTNKTVEINNAQQLAGLAGLVNGTYAGGPKTFEGYTISLNRDIDLANLPWTPIGCDYDDAIGASAPQPKVFRGTFKGNDHTISNLSIVAKNGGVAENFGLFGNIFFGASISDLTLRNVDIDAYSFSTSSSTVAGSCGALVGALFSSASHYYSPEIGYNIDNIKVENVTINAQHYAAGLIGYCVAYGPQRQVNITNCSVDNATIVAKTSGLDNGNKVGGLVGQMMTAGSPDSNIAAIKIDNCTVNNATIQGYREVGGLTGAQPVGYSAATTIYCTNNTVSNTTIIQDLSDDYKAPKTPTSVGEISGYYLQGASPTTDATYLDLTGTKAVNVTIEKAFIVAAASVAELSTIDLSANTEPVVTVTLPSTRTELPGTDITIGNSTWSSNAALQKVIIKGGNIANTVADKMYANPDIHTGDYDYVSIKLNVPDQAEVVIDGWTISGAYCFANGSPSGYTIKSLTIQNCELYGVWHGYLERVTDLVFDHNNFDHTGVDISGFSKFSAYPFWLKTNAGLKSISLTNNVVKCNRGFHIEERSPTAILIEGNTFALKPYNASDEVSKVFGLQLLGSNAGNVEIYNNDMPTGTQLVVLYTGTSGGNLRMADDSYIYIDGNNLGDGVTLVDMDTWHAPWDGLQDFIDTYVKFAHK